MADIVIRDVPEHMRADLEARARQSGRSLSDEAKALLDDVIEAGRARQAGQHNAFDALREAFEGAFMTDEEHADFMQAVQEMRREVR
ncbi:FitA-like ribbon-helix-helix domain-containing protein [Roseitalea porphyridii]|uniref:Antitoxin FitA-like ribbon-helix-helix domain-containing protein n=1 Tax=Roseitalea porphyridii TaxID=1852022 RepID=A0A4P6V5V4_9HYPH|nr:hypothetical protein [Roseitalea porphyridii]QBK32129.1 hypothetical protein E0E05_16985 [Roseitalea porphyridii]